MKRRTGCLWYPRERCRGARSMSFFLRSSTFNRRCHRTKNGARYAPRCSAAGDGRTAKSFWPISGFQPTAPAPARAWRPWWWMVRKIFATGKNSACTSFCPDRAFWWARYRTKSATSAARSPWLTPIFREAPRLRPSLENNKDFEALGSLILALEKIAAMDLRQMADQASSVDLASLLEEFRIVVEPSLEEKDIRLTIEIDRRHAAGMGGPAEPAPGLPESDEKQRTRNDGSAGNDERGRRNPARTRDRSALCEAAGNGALPGYRRRRRSSGPALSPVSAAGAGHRAGIVFVESVHEIVPRRSAV